MAENEDIRSLRGTANDLNNLLQVILESSAALQPLAESTEEGRKYHAFLSNAVERAIKVTAQLSSNLGGLSDTSPTVSPQKADTGKVSPIVNPNGERELVLIIDDEEVIGAFAGEMLGNQGYRVAVALEPFRALELFTQYKDEISLVILDFTLPIMDGSEVFDELRKIKPNVAVMLSSGFAEQDKVRLMLAKGLRGFLPKPYTEEKLLTQVRMVLNSIRSEKTGERRIL